MRKGSFGSRYLQVWVGFAVSALLHQAGAMVGCFAEGGKWQGIYFMVQPVGIMIEDAAIHIGKSAGIQDSGKPCFILSFPCNCGVVEQEVV